MGTTLRIEKSRDGSGVIVGRRKINRSNEVIIGAIMGRRQSPPNWPLILLTFVFHDIFKALSCGIQKLLDHASGNANPRFLVLKLIFAVKQGMVKALLISFLLQQVVARLQLAERRIRQERVNHLGQ